MAIDVIDHIKGVYIDKEKTADAYETFMNLYDMMVVMAMPIFVGIRIKTVVESVSSTSGLSSNHRHSHSYFLVSLSRPCKGRAQHNLSVHCQIVFEDDF